MVAFGNADGADAFEDEIIFHFYKKEKVKMLKSKLTVSDLNELKARYAHLYGDATSVARFMSDMKSTFGSSIDPKLLDGIGSVFEKHFGLIPIDQRKASEKMLLDVVKIVNDHLFTTPVCQIKPTIQLIDAGTSNVNEPPRRGNLNIKDKNLTGKVLFPEERGACELVDDVGLKRKRASGSAGSCGKALNEPIRIEEDDEAVNGRTCFEKVPSNKHIDRSKKNIHGNLSPEVHIVKVVNSGDRVREMLADAEKIYNQSIAGAKSSKAGPSRIVHYSEMNPPNNGPPSFSFVSGCLSDVQADADPSCFESTINRPDFVVTPEERKIYNIVCSLASSRHSKLIATDIGLCHVTFFSLGESMALGHEVCTYVVNCMCRNFFLDVRPTISLKHYFFSGVSSVFMSDLKDYSAVEKSFIGAATVLPLHGCSMLFFPVLYNEHWFLFVVDLSNKMFLFIDSLFSKRDEFSVLTRNKLVGSFRFAWAKFVGPDPGFSNFQIAYPHVPKQGNKYDCGVFLIKFMELWDPSINLCDKFSQDDIANIRVKIVNELVNSAHNKADLQVMGTYPK